MSPWRPAEGRRQAGVGNPRRPAERRRRAGVGLFGSVAVLAAALWLASSGGATSLPQRTFPVSAGTTGASADPVVSADASTVAFDAAQSGSPITNVYSFDVLTGTSSLVSSGLGGAAANGVSSTPAISNDGSEVAFASTATNLVANPVTGAGDIYVRTAGGAVKLVSVGIGGPANAASSQPSISADGRYVAFTSAASNLVPGDTNAVTDVFVADLDSGTITRVSVGHGSVQANAASTGPAISADGSTISFDSGATNLVSADHNGVADVFVRVPATDTTERVSISTSGAEQNRSATAGFSEVSSVSANGRLVVFDSTATNLVHGEDQTPRSNVFLRDRLRHTTTLLSEGNAGYEGNNDSFAPFVTPSGLYVGFESFANNLASGGGPRENVYVRDLTLRTTSVIDVAPNGSPPGRELVSELLERPTLSNDGTVATFMSSAANMTGNTSGLTEVFLRLLTPPRGVLRGSAPPAGPSRHPRVVVGADDPHATLFECRIDHQLPFNCRPGALQIPSLSTGAHTLLVRAGGPGMLYDPLGLRIKLRVT
jgi:Tol biopolymer transport system component